MKLTTRSFPLLAAAVAVGLLLTLGARTSAADDAIYSYQNGQKITLVDTGLKSPDGDTLYKQASTGSVAKGFITGATDSTLVSLTSKFMVHVGTATNIDTLTTSWGAQSYQSLDYAPGYYLVEASSADAALQMANQAVENNQVLDAEPQYARQQVKRDLPNDPQFGNQWHLRNTGQGSGTVGADINVTPWWNFSGGTHLGAGVNIAMVDDGLQRTHPDLIGNYQANLSWDFNGNDSDPSPTVSADFHGTATAGLAAGRGNNGIGITGVAPLAGLAGIRLIAAAATDSQEASALTYQNNNQGGLGTNSIYSNSWGPNDDGATLEGPGTLAKAALASGVTNGRGGKGSIFVWAGGNGGTVFDNSNYDGYANSRYVIAVAATKNNANGSRASYSEKGANLLVNAPSSGGSLSIVTTDLVGTNGYNTASSASGGDYTNTFGGTSAATPIVSGTVALMLEANPNLTWRDVKHILVHTAAKNDPTEADWTNNAAGLHINHSYGFGRVDANAAATMALAWANVGPEVSATASSAANLNLSIADGTGTSYSNPIFGAAVSNSLIISSLIKVEEVEVSVNVTHTYRGDLQFQLTAPSGTVSILGTPRNDSADNYSNWVFTTVRDWDEMANGTWTLSVKDGLAADTGKLNSWSLNVYGTMVPEPSTLGLMTLGSAIAVVKGLRSRRRASEIAA